jgi:hypothetical protein
MNGRVVLNQSDIPYERVPFKEDTQFRNDAMKGIHQKNTLNEVFFSKENIDALQHGIRHLVWVNSCKRHVIGNQSEDELKIIMRSIYLQYSKNQPFHIIEQVKELNAKVLEYAVNTILHEIEMYLNYRKDITQLPTPLERSPNVSSKGSKTLEFKSL